MLCEKCKTDIVGEGSVCKKCGQAQTKASSKKRKLGKITLGVMISAVIVLIFCAVYDYNEFSMRLKEDQVKACKAKLRGVQVSLELYNKHHKKFPGDLKKLVHEGYLGAEWEKDTWGKSYKYEVRGGSNYHLYSSGPDKKFGTNDDVLCPIDGKRHSLSGKIGVAPPAEK